MSKKSLRLWRQAIHINIYSTKVGIDKTATKLIQSENIGKELGGSRDGGGSKKGFRHLQL